VTDAVSSFEFVLAARSEYQLKQLVSRNEAGCPSRAPLTGDPSSASAAQTPSRPRTAASAVAARD